MQTTEVEPPRRRDRPAPDHALLIRAEQIRAQYRNMPGAFVGSAAAASLVAASLYESLAPDVVLLWLAAAYAQSFGRFLLWRWFKRVDPSPADIERWGWYSVVTSGTAGILWGIGGMVLHVPGNLSHQLFVLMATTGLAFTSAFISAPFMPAFRALVYPNFGLATLPFLLEGDSIHVGIGVVALLFLPLISRYASGVSRSFLESVNVRLQNAELVEELRERKESAEEANVAKSRFLAVASHDLRQPLHALGLFVQALQESALPAHERTLVANVRRSVDAMEELFDALLDISRLDAGVVRARVETFALACVFDRLRLEYSAVAQQLGLSLTVMKSSVYVRSDPTLLARILRNLLVNALRYTDCGGVVIGCRRRGSKVSIEVWDTGRGIPADKRREIFREFTQLQHPERDRRTGLGLGLAIVERLARLLGHEVELRSAVGRGSVFAITLQRGQKEDQVARDARAESTAAFDLSGTLILVIDDDSAVRQGMEVLLGKWNCEVITAASGAQMMENLATAGRIPDLIISDYRLRADENGIAVVEMLRNEFNAEIPALVMTGDTGSERPRDYEAGGLPILHKPVNPARLRTLMANLLRQRPAAQTRPRRVSSVRS